jgi:hypothetical protein
MLFDPKWETKTDTWAMPSFVAWLENQPPEKTYNWLDCRGACLISQYMTANGIEWYDEGLLLYSSHVPEEFKTVAVRHPRTFGAALHRARNIGGR